MLSSKIKLYCTLSLFSSDCFFHNTGGVLKYNGSKHSVAYNNIGTVPLCFVKWLKWMRLFFMNDRAVISWVPVLIVEKSVYVSAY